MQPLPPGLEIFITTDGSPTLVHRREDGYQEKMHHSGGALSESVYIYHQALAMALDRGWPARVISLGLGLGYNELLAAGEFYKRRITDWKIWSFELQAPLREGFRSWLQMDECTTELERVLTDVLARVSGTLDIPAAELKRFLRDGALELRGPFPQDAHGITGSSVVFYDAFSNKMNPELWSESLLTGPLQDLLAPGCALATYAATGSLNRSLKSLGFRLLEKPGFAGKRESTLAIRDEFR